nr:hypothetical protein [Chloroflexota bacterium]
MRERQCGEGRKRIAAMAVGMLLLVLAVTLEAQQTVPEKALAKAKGLVAPHANLAQTSLAAY